MNRLTIVVAGFLAVGCLVATHAFGEQKAGNEKQMKKKLEYSKNILEGMVTEDYGKIATNAKALNKIGEQKWQETESPEYRTQNQVYWFTTGTLLMAAEEKNLDGVTLSYTQMTMSCVNCHRLLRGQKQ